MRDKLVIIPCGKKKIWDDGVTKGQVRAGDAYTGTLFKLGVIYAKVYDADFVILSAKYGYISPEVLIEPYDVTFSRKASNPVSYKVLSSQLFELDLWDYKEVVALGGAEYRKAVIDSFACGGRTEIKTPFTGLKIGEYLHALKEAIELEMYDNEARSYNVSESKPLEFNESGKISFLWSYWKIPTVESAFSGLFEGKPTREEEKWEHFKIKVKREILLDLGPKPGAWDQLIGASFLIGKKILIQMWNPWMFIDEEEAPIQFKALFTGIKLIHNEEGFLQCYMCLKDVQSPNGWDGSPRVKHLSDGLSLLSLGEIYELTAIEK